MKLYYTMYFSNQKGQALTAKIIVFCNNIRYNFSEKNVFDMDQNDRPEFLQIKRRFFHDKSNCQ